MEPWHSPGMTKGDETRLRNLQAKKAAKKILTPLDNRFLKKLTAQKLAENGKPEISGTN